jgi:hypothetical protein
MNQRNPVLPLFVALALAGGLGCSNPYTPAGHEGYVFERPRLSVRAAFAAPSTARATSVSRCSATR